MRSPGLAFGAGSSATDARTSAGATCDDDCARRAPADSLSHEAVILCHLTIVSAIATAAYLLRDAWAVRVWRVASAALCTSLPISLMQRIADLPGCKHLEMDYIGSIGHDGMVARVSRFGLACGQFGYLIEPFCYLDSEGRWSRLGVLGGREVRSAAQLLTEVARFLDASNVRPFAPVLEDD